MQARVAPLVWRALCSSVYIMKSIPLATAVLLATLLSPGAAATDCRAIVANTLAELQAAYPDWDDGMETLARTAAGSACVKASGTTKPATTSTQLRERPVSAGSAAPTAAGTPVAAAGSAAGDTATSTKTTEEEGEGGWNPFKEIKFNKVSASPNKKPYERRREVNDAAPLEDESE